MKNSEILSDAEEKSAENESPPRGGPRASKNGIDPLLQNFIRGFLGIRGWGRIRVVFLNFLFFLFLQNVQSSGST